MVKVLASLFCLLSGSVLAFTNSDPKSYVRYWDHTVLENGLRESKGETELLWTYELWDVGGPLYRIHQIALNDDKEESLIVTISELQAKNWPNQVAVERSLNSYGNVGFTFDEPTTLFFSSTLEIPLGYSDFEFEYQIDDELRGFDSLYLISSGSTNFYRMYEVIEFEAGDHSFQWSVTNFSPQNIESSFRFLPVESVTVPEPSALLLTYFPHISQPIFPNFPQPAAGHFLP